MQPCKPIPFTLHACDLQARQWQWLASGIHHLQLRWLLHTLLGVWVGPGKQQLPATCSEPRSHGAPGPPAAFFQMASMVALLS